MSTALERYARLEAEGRYFDGRSAAPREVVVSFGRRSLVIMDLAGQPLAHWPLASLRALGRRGEMPVQIVPHGGSDERLLLLDPEMLAAIGEICPDLWRREVDRRGTSRAIGWLAGAVAAVVAMVFFLLPALAGQLALLIPPEREQQLGDAVAGQLQSLLAYLGDRKPGFCENEEGGAALAALATRLAPETPLPYPLRIDVLDHPLVNAVALPGGRIILFRGLLKVADTPEEVAGVLAHEIGHALHRDPTREALRAAGTAGILGLLLGDVFGASVIVIATDAVLNASYQRKAEARADEIAFGILERARLPSTPFARFFEKMRKRYGDSRGVLKFIASHPGLAERAERAAAADRIGKDYQPALDAAQWAALKGICRSGKARLRRPGENG